MRKLFKFIAPLALMPSMVAPMIVTSCGGKMYKYVEQLTDYLHVIEYDDYREDTKWETIKEAEPFGCSSVRSGNFYGRNFDYVFNDTPEFIVKVKANPEKNRYKSIAVATHFGLREKKLLDGKYDKSLELVPNLTMDGINENGVICSSNVVSMEPNKELGEGGIPETRPNEEGLKQLHALFIPRYVLDHATSASNAVDLLRNVNIVGNLKDEMNLHIMIADKNQTFVVEFYKGKGQTHNHFDVIAEEKLPNEETKYPIMTNYYVNNHDDLEAFTNDQKFGDERYEILKAGYIKDKDSMSMDKMANLLKQVRFSLAYEKNHNHIPLHTQEGAVKGDLTSDWYSEKIGQKLLSSFDVKKDWDKQGGDLGNDIDALIKTKDAYVIKDRFERNPAFWITTHNSTYDMDDKKLRVIVQEQYDKYYEFDLDDWQ